MRLVRLGHEPAFEQLYDRHHRGILSFCRHMLGSRDEAEDAVQHTFIAAYRDLRASDKPIHLKAWLYTIARNRCLSVLRARREQVAIEDVEPSVDGLAAEVQRRQDLKDMLRDLHRLPHDQRAALVLSELGALSHEEIAMTLDVRKEKVKALVFQARESLISSRRAREADCAEIQQQLAVLRGGSLRRTTLRRHLEHCPACQEYRAEVQRQRAALAIILPVAPTAGLKGGVLGGAVSAGAGAAGGGALAGGAGGTVGAKLIVGAVIAGAGLGGGLMAIDELTSPPSSAADEQHRGRSQVPLHAADRDRHRPPSDGDAARVVAALRSRASDAAAQRAADRRAGSGHAVWASPIPGNRTGPDPAVVVSVITDPVSAAEEAVRKPKKADDGKPGRGRGHAKKAKKPKVPQGQGAQGKGKAYGRGREPAASAGRGRRPTPSAGAPQSPGRSESAPGRRRAGRRAVPGRIAPKSRAAPPRAPAAGSPAAPPAPPRRGRRSQATAPAAKALDDAKAAAGGAKDAVDGQVPGGGGQAGDAKGRLRTVVGAVLGIAPL
ncbi:MAG TPA: RNA polymerase sigma factor [Solirubrobacteraceae bacterium]|nr:RNA polymerase sigma factor [Solirubrobacteraceae bacterium]